MTSSDLSFFLFIFLVATTVGGAYYLKTKSKPKEFLWLVSIFWALFWLVLSFVLNRLKFISEWDSFNIILFVLLCGLAFYMHESKDKNEEDASIQDRIDKLSKKNKK